MAGGIGRSDLPVPEKDCPQDDFKRPQTSGRTCDRPDSSVGSGSGYHSQGTWLGDVYAWTDPDLRCRDLGSVI